MAVEFKVKVVFKQVLAGNVVMVGIGLLAITAEAVVVQAPSVTETV